MSERRDEEEKKYRSLHAYVVIFVFVIMVSAGSISMVIFNILDAFGLIRHIYVVPMLLPLIMLCACVIIGSLMTAFLAGYFLKPLNELKKGLKKVTEGDFAVRLEDISANSEIAQIQRNFNLMAKELQSTELFRNDFINNFSHEFKTPMVSVHGFAKQLKKGGLTKEQEQEYIDIILSESQRLINMSTNILLLGKLENQEVISDKVKFSLDEEIRQSILMLCEEWSAKDIEIIPELEEVEYYGNPNVLKHVWLNIIGNAIKYTDEKGCIEVTLKIVPENEEVEFAVSDNGIGMDSATTERIFEKFYQGDSSRSNSGNGLGLAMVKRITELCGGRIKVRSEKGKGTDFYVYLPYISEKTEEKKKKMIVTVDTAALK
ncbi:MAG: HAMP domain-containing histidine kinase [Ruminococcaceae bacterium]|nr:HAMP domain-containing histidine kinase [Oscillospiraceae bacterium]